MKSKKEEEEDDAKFCSLKVPMDHTDKESKIYIVKVKKYDSGTPEEFFKWRLILNKQMKNHGYSSYDMVMNSGQAMLAGRSLEAFLNERRAQEAKNKTRKAKEQTMHTPQHIYDCAIFELAIRAFDIESGWRDAYERQREYMRRDLFMGKLNPEKFSQRLQDLTSIWIISQLKEQHFQTRQSRHMESHCQKMKSGPLWDKQSHLNGQ
jgi:hypothetical protein